MNAAISNVLTSSTTQYNAAFGGNGSPTYQGSTLPFSLKVNVNGSNGSGISGATVSAGNSLGTACSESGSSGIYYCAIPLADSDTAISASKAGYYPGLGMYTDRTLASDPQGGFAFTLNSIPSTNSPAVNYYSGGGGMSSGGGSYYAPVSSTVQPANCPAGFTCRPTVVSGCPQGYSCNPVVANTSPATTADSNSFTKNLELGAVGNDVRALQSFLNNHGYPIAVSGVGSVGHETTTFGSLTKNSLIKFQKANGIKPASGYFGPITRAFVAEMLGGN